MIQAAGQTNVMRVMRAVFFRGGREMMRLQGLDLDTDMVGVPQDKLPSEPQIGDLAGNA